MTVAGPAQLHTTAKEVLTWVAPTVGIPALRYFQDDRRERNRLFIRDASTYTLGTLIFLVVYRTGLALLRKHPMPLSERKRDLTAFLVALAANILYAGVGAVRLSQALGRTLQPSPPSKPSPGLRTAFPNTSPFPPVSPLPNVFRPNAFGTPTRIARVPAFQADAFRQASPACFSWPVQRYGGLPGYGATLYG